MRKAIVSAIVLSLLVFAVAGCSKAPQSQPSQPAQPQQPTQPAQPAEKVIKVGEVHGLSGTNAMVGKWIADGIAMAVEEINARAPKGYKLQVIKYDDEGDPSKTVSLVKRLITDDKVHVAFQHSSNSTLAALPYWQEAKIPHFTLGTNDEIVSKGSKYVIRVHPGGMTFVKAGVDYFAKKQGLKRWAFLAQTDAAGVAITNPAEKLLAELDLKPVTKQSFNPEDKDFTGQLTEIIRQKADIILLGGFEVPQGLIVKQARRMGFKGPITGNLTITTPTVIEIAGEAAEGLIGPQPYVPTATEKSRAFDAAFQKKYGYQIGPQGAGAYDAMMMIEEAINKYCTEPITPEGLAEALHKIQNWEGVEGVYSVDETGDAMKNPTMVIVKNGKIEPLPK